LGGAGSAEQVYAAVRKKPQRKDSLNEQLIPPGVKPTVYFEKVRHVGRSNYH